MLQNPKTCFCEHNICFFFPKSSTRCFFWVWLLEAYFDAPLQDCAAITENILSLLMETPAKVGTRKREVLWIQWLMACRHGWWWTSVGAQSASITGLPCDKAFALQMAKKTTVITVITEINMTALHGCLGMSTFLRNIALEGTSDCVVDGMPALDSCCRYHKWAA